MDGVHVSPSELLLATGEQVITGKKIFRNGMTVADLQVAGFLNGVNLHEFIRMAVSTRLAFLNRGLISFSSFSSSDAQEQE